MYGLVARVSVLTTLAISLPCGCAAALWGISADFANCDPAQSACEAPVLAGMGVGCVALSHTGADYNWPDWVQVDQTWRRAGCATIWDLPASMADIERIFGLEQGTFEIDDRARAEDGSTFRFGPGQGIGNFFNPGFVYHSKRAARALASRLRNSTGYLVTSRPDLKNGSYDGDALSSWQSFLRTFTGDTSPDEDSNRDSTTFNLAFGTSHASWESVPMFRAAELDNPRKRTLTDLWLASSYAEYVDSLCAEARTVNRPALAGPLVSGKLTGSSDVSTVLARPSVTAVYTDNPEDVAVLDSAAAAFRKKAAACGVKLVQGDEKASLQRAIRLLPYASAVCFDYAGLVAERSGEISRESGVRGEPRPFGTRVEVKPATIVRFDPAFYAVSRLAPFAGKVRIDRRPVLWIVSSSPEGIVDSAWVSEAALAINPDCIDFSSFRAVIYRSDSPCASLAIMQRLFDYALAGGTVFLDAWGVASGPTLLGRDNRHFWWQELACPRETWTEGMTSVSFAGQKWEFPFNAPYLTAGRHRTLGRVTDSSGAEYPLLIIRSIGNGKWVFVNIPGWDRHPSLLNAVVRAEAGIDLPDPAGTLVYAGEECAVAIAGASPAEAELETTFERTALLDPFSGEAAVAEGQRIRLPGRLQPGEARLWVVKPFGRPVVLYVDGGTRDAASVDGGKYENGSLTFDVSGKAYISSPIKPVSAAVDGRPVPFEYDPERCLVILEWPGQRAEARLVFGD